MHNFDEKSLVTDYIINLINNTNLPSIEVAFPGKYLYKNQIYISKNYIIKCLQSGIYFEDAKVKYIADYVKNAIYPKLTHRYRFSDGIYSKDVHYAFGQYLRYYKSITDIDVMRFYNCFGNQYISNISINPNNPSSLISIATNSTLITACVPIKFNTVYTIGLESSSQVKGAAAFLLGDTLLKQVASSEASLSQVYLTKYPSAIFMHSSNVFRFPFKYKAELKEADMDMLKYERYLYLLIQFNAASSVTVLEGDYNSRNCQVIMDLSSDINDVNLNRQLQSELQLLRYSDDKSYPFSDRLIEILSGSAITNQDTYYINSQSVQDNLTKANPSKYTTGIWNAYTRKITYDSIMNDPKAPKLDVTGFGDKDVQEILNVN